MYKLCYTTAFIDIGRDEWQSHNRTFSNYLTSFLPLIEMFKRMVPDELLIYQLIIFIDSKRYDKLLPHIPTNLPIIVISCDDAYLKCNTVLWNRLDQEREIMESPMYKSIFHQRLYYPENSNPKYTIVNHCKVDFIHIAQQITDADFFCWVDFGYFKLPHWIPENPIDISLLDTNTVHYTLINPLDENDKNILHTMHNAPERIGGFFFGGSRNALSKYRELYHRIHENFQEMGLVDDDQHMALRCYFEEPSLFTLTHLGNWHLALLYFQKKKNKIC
jgi:hypothetical protein